MRVHLFSYNYAPEPTGIAPVSTAWAEAVAAAGHEVRVTAAHPHYPESRWGNCLLPYRELRGGISITRWPLWIGRRTAAQRVRQEVTFSAAQSAAVVTAPSCDVAVVVSPSFPALAPTMAGLALRRTPWILWLQDILPDGATSTGMVQEGTMLRAARALERRAYASADHVVVISDRFKENLLQKGVPEEKITRIYNPCTTPITTRERTFDHATPQILSIGNIGFSQGLDQVIRAFEESPELEAAGARMVITGAGVAEPDVKAAIRTARVDLPGLLDADGLQREFDHTTLALVSQRADVAEFNMPSKLMNYMAQGLPVLALARPGSELERVVLESGCGWVLDNSRLDRLGPTISGILSDQHRLSARAEAGRRYAAANFTAEAVAGQFLKILMGLTTTGR